MGVIRSQSNVNVTTGDTRLVGGNMRRVGLIVGAPKTNTVWLSFVGPAAVGVGIPLRPGQLPLVLGDDEMTAALMEEIRAASEVAAENIGVIEFLK